MNVRERTVKLLVVAATGALGACSEAITLQDDLYPDTGWRSEDDDGNVLHAPYATGSRFGVSVSGLSPEECAKLQVEAGDAAVLGLEPDPEDPCRVTVTASGAGHTTLRVVDGDETVGEARVEVATATRATIHPRGMVRAGLPEADGPWESAKVVRGSTATFTVRWWDDEGRELAAHELLVPTTTSDGLRLDPPPGQPREPDALQVTPVETGVHHAEVGTAGARFAAIDIEAVAEEDLVDLTLVRGAIAGPNDDRSVLLAVCHDATGDPVFGPQPTWRVDGAPVLADGGEVLPGDMFVFASGGDETQVQADALGLEASESVTLHGEPSVESSNGCQATPGLPATSSAFVLLAAGLVLRRLRRTVAR